MAPDAGATRLTRDGGWAILTEFTQSAIAWIIGALAGIAPEIGLSTG
jgi:hypothetical protein